MPRPHNLIIEYLAVFAGGALGSSIRELLIPALPELAWVTATFEVNLVACFVLGWLYAVRHRVHAHVMHLGAVGFCGGLSTFSSFAEDIFQLLATGQYVDAIRAPALEIVFGIGVALLGEMLGRRWHGEATR